jgi:hypothetical protein
MDSEMDDKVAADLYRPTSNDPLNSRKQISDVWSGGPPKGHLHIFVGMKKADRPAAGECLIRHLPWLCHLTNLLLEGEMKGIPPEYNLAEYSDIFVKVREWAGFCHSDIEDNNIHDTRGRISVLPTFVAEFNRELDRKPSLDPVRCFVDFPVSCSILMDQCRRILHRIYYPSLNHILSFPGTRPLD